MELSIGIVTLNARYVHTSLSLRYLRNAARNAGCGNVWIEEFVINRPTWKIAAAIQKRKPDVLGLSVYIWNRTQSFELIELLKKQTPDLRIVVGGPEVSFEKQLSSDYTTIAGEGEQKWVEYLGYIKDGQSPPDDVLKQWNNYEADLPELIPAYLEEDIPKIRDRIVYLETSRGCPYLCSFCLSALDKTIRYFDDDLVRAQIKLLIGGGVTRIKFVDRTFNIHHGRMKEFMQWLTGFEGVEFHFEVVGDILTDDLLEFLKTVPEGMFQFEIGIQSVNEKVQKLIHRKQNNKKLLNAIKNLMESGRVHLHCDLIFGLPGETREDMLDSLARVIALKPHELQLGFLKFLPGTPIRDVIESHDYRFQSSPPYEFICNKDISAQEATWLKMFAEAFDTFYNSRRFKFSVDLLMTAKPPVEIFDDLLRHMEKQNLLNAPLSLEDQYRVFYDAFGVQSDPLAMDVLKLDYLYSQRVYHLPKFLRNGAENGKHENLKTWRGDRRTPVIPFSHEIRLTGGGAHLTPSPTLLYYAIAHPKENSGYLNRPRIEAVK